MKLILGTAQFGLAYGITRPANQLDDTSLKEILDCALSAGITELDTSPAYGNAEERLGKQSKIQNFAVQSKTFGGRKDLGPKDMEVQLARSLKCTKRDFFDSYLIHSTSQLFGPCGSEILTTLLNFKKQGLVKRIGISAYDGHDIDRILERFTPDVVQLPCSLADQRLIYSGHLQRLRERGVTIQARSVFLQGLLLSSPDTLPDGFKKLRPVLKKMQTYKMSQSKICLDFLTDCGFVNEVVLGVHSAQQLEIIVKSFSEPVRKRQWRDFALPDDIVDPRQWL